MMTVRNAVLMLGIVGIFFAFACPLAPTPILVCKAFLLLIFVFVLTLMSRTARVIAAAPADIALSPAFLPECSAPSCAAILRC